MSSQGTSSPQYYDHSTGRFYYTHYIINTLNNIFSIQCFHCLCISMHISFCACLYHFVKKKVSAPFPCLVPCKQPEIQISIFKSMLGMPFGYCGTQTHTHTHVLMLLPWKLCPLCSSFSPATQMSYLCFVKWKAIFETIYGVAAFISSLEKTKEYLNWEIFWEVRDTKRIFLKL